MLNYAMVDNIDLTKEFNEDELKKIDELYHAKIEFKNDAMVKKEKHDLKSYFIASYSKEYAIFKALRDGYTQKEIGYHLGLSHVAISKIVRIYKQKVKLFNKLRDKGIFWSYKKDVTYDEVGAELFSEYLLKYGDFDDIKLGFELFGKRYMKEVWDAKLKSDKSFIKTNLMLARVFFGMDVESDYFREVKNARFEKLKLLAS
jgi:uncharacterized protein YerC